MGKKLGLLLLLMCLLLVTPIFAAKITGAIYDHDLTPIKKTILTINTSPEQTRVATYGGYYFLADPGTYLITATFSKNEITKEIASETITIIDNGEYARDLFLYPDFDLQEEFEDTWTNKLQSFFESNGVFVGLIFGSLLILIIITLFGTKYVKLLFKRELREYVTEQKTKSTKDKKSTLVKEETQPLVIPQSYQEKTDEMIEKKILKILKTKKEYISNDIKI